MWSLSAYTGNSVKGPSLHCIEDGGGLPSWTCQFSLVCQVCSVRACTIVLKNDVSFHCHEVYVSVCGVSECSKHHWQFSFWAVNQAVCSSDILLWKVWIASWVEAPINSLLLLLLLWRYSCFVLGGTSFHHQPLTLKMEATYTSETFAKSPTTRQYNNPRTQLISIISYTFQYL
jgi:hypothetical protein